MNEGWICPICRTANSPQVFKCCSDRGPFGVGVPLPPWLPPPATGGTVLPSATVTSVSYTVNTLSDAVRKMWDASGLNPVTQ